MLFSELPLVERPAAARRAGFELVESWWPDPADAGDFERELRRNGLAVACLNCFGGDLQAGERGFLNLPERYERTLADFTDALAYGARVGAPLINVLVGRAVADVPFGRQRAVAVSTLRDIAAEAAAAGSTVLVEPLNAVDVPGCLVPTPAAAVSLIEEVGSGAVALLYDAYHAAAAGFDPATQAVELLDCIRHVQYADYPGRGAPGTGSLRLDEFAAALDGAGYRGAIGLEFAPHGPTPSHAEIAAFCEWPGGPARDTRGRA